MVDRKKYTDAPVVISTWQSIYKEKGDFFNRFDVVIGTKHISIKQRVSLRYWRSA